LLDGERVPECGAHREVDHRLLHGDLGHRLDETAEQHLPLASPQAVLAGHAIEHLDHGHVLAPEDPLERRAARRWLGRRAPEAIELGIDLGLDGDAHRATRRWNDRSIRRPNRWASCGELCLGQGPPAGALETWPVAALVGS
jgi:hypothetical protein